MKIENYAINMSSNHSYAEAKTSEEKLRYWNGNDRVEFEKKENSIMLTQNNMDSLEISKEALKLQEKDAVMEKVNPSIEKTNDDNNIQLTISEEDKQKIRMLEEFITKLTGKRFKLQVVDKIKLKDECTESLEKINALPSINSTQSQQPQRQGWGLEYNLHSSYQESEKMTFSTNGIVKTQDGRSIDFTFELNMSREFASEANINIKAGDATIDPLVINYSGKNLKLTDNKISFDINVDSTKENISFTSEGSGFLALDLNNDGVINDGKELFGPTTGNGFKELKKYDVDNNNWIDENDSIFKKLTIWTKDENGDDKLFALGQVGIGAVYVGNIATEYSIKNDENTTLGKIRYSGIFLKENGNVGTVQHLDLSV